MIDEDPSLDPNDPPTMKNSSEDGEPTWIHRVVIVILMGSAILLTFSYLYPTFESKPNSPSTELPSWKKQANEIISIALEQQRKRIPELIQLTSSNHEGIRQNAIWALHYLTGLPWGEKLNRCKTWWKKHGDAWLSGSEPATSPPSSDRFKKELSPDEVNIEVFFNVRSPRRILLSEENELINYEVGISNQNEETTIELLPPEMLPYKAFRYKSKLPKNIQSKLNLADQYQRVPVHLQYGPSVAFISLSWFDPAKSLDEPFRNEFLEFSVLGRGDSTIGPKQLMATRKPFPIRFEEDLKQSESPHLILRLSLDGRRLLTKYQNERIRVPFESIHHTIHIFERAPEQVPGYDKTKLQRIKEIASKRGYTLQRAERIQVGAYSQNSIPESRADSGIHASNKATGSTRWSPWTQRRTYAANQDELPEGTILFDPQLGWGEVETSCSSCTPSSDHPLKLGRIEAYIGELGNELQARPKEQKRSGSRWVLVFDKDEKPNENQ